MGGVFFGVFWVFRGPGVFQCLPWYGRDVGPGDHTMGTVPVRIAIGPRHLSDPSQPTECLDSESSSWSKMALLVYNSLCGLDLSADHGLILD